MREDIIRRILDRNNLNEAFKRVKANKGASGIDDMDIEETKAYIKEHKNTIVWQLYNRKYQPQPVRRVEIPKPNGGKMLINKLFEGDIYTLRAETFAK